MVIHAGTAQTCAGRARQLSLPPVAALRNVACLFRPTNGNRERRLTITHTSIGPFICGGDQPLTVIAGPCVLENAEGALVIASHLAEIANRLPIQLVFKASFDKANRTSVDAYRGPGLTAGLQILATIAKEFGLPVTTDIHLPEEAEPAAAVCDLLQIPAFLCRQTDLLVAAAGTGKAVNVKKGQFMAAEDMRHVVGKLLAADCRNVLLCERRYFFRLRTPDQ